MFSVERLSGASALHRASFETDFNSVFKIPVASRLRLRQPSFHTGVCECTRTKANLGQRPPSQQCDSLLFVISKDLDMHSVAVADANFVWDVERPRVPERRPIRIERDCVGIDRDGGKFVSTRVFN